MFTEALTDPVAILDKFNPTIAEAGILNKLAPDPENEPLIKKIEPVKAAFPSKAKDPLISAEPVKGKVPSPAGPLGP